MQESNVEREARRLLRLSEVQMMIGRQPELEPTAPWNEEFMEIMREIAEELKTLTDLLQERMG